MRAPVIQISAEVAHAHAKHNGSLRKRASQSAGPNIRLLLQQDVGKAERSGSFKTPS
ncbi:hypothetical protein ACVWY5_001494 [Bradyrhizobium sp. USDA 3256]